MNQILKENIIKNILIAIILLALYLPIQDYLLNSEQLYRDIGLTGDILVAVSIVAVIACFGNFAFTYEKVNIKKKDQRYLAHLTTGLLMLIIGISLIFSTILISTIMGPFILVNITFALLYLACVLYDFWDLFIVQN